MQLGAEIRHSGISEPWGPDKSAPASEDDKKN